MFPPFRGQGNKSLKILTLLKTATFVVLFLVSYSVNLLNLFAGSSVLVVEWDVNRFRNRVL